MSIFVKIIELRTRNTMDS